MTDHDMLDALADLLDPPACPQISLRDGVDLDLRTARAVAAAVARITLR